MSHHVFTALYKSYLDKREKLLVEKCSGLEKAEAELQNERKLFESERGLLLQHFIDSTQKYLIHSFLYINKISDFMKHYFLILVFTVTTHMQGFTTSRMFGFLLASGRQI